MVECTCKYCGTKYHAGEFSPQWGSKECDLCWRRRVFGIIHKALAYAKTAPEQEWYLCNQAVKPNQDKLAYYWAKVTCKNCLKQQPMKKFV